MASEFTTAIAAGGFERGLALIEGDAVHYCGDDRYDPDDPPGCGGVVGKDAGVIVTVLREYYGHEARLCSCPGETFADYQPDDHELEWLSGDDELPF